MPYLREKYGGNAPTIITEYRKNEKDTENYNEEVLKNNMRKFWDHDH
jgi:hypothetical protein